MNMQTRTITVNSRASKLNGKSKADNQPSDARAKAEALFRQIATQDAVQPAIPSVVQPETKPQRQVSIAITEKRARVRFAYSLWDALGRPAKVGITGTPEAFQIRSGGHYTIQKVSTKAVSFDINPEKIGLEKTNQPAIHLEAKISNDCILIDPLPGHEPSKKLEPESGEPARSVFTNEAPPVEQREEDYQLGTLGVRGVNNGGCGLVFGIPRVLLEELDSPKRLIIDGKPHTGYTMTPTTEDREGLKVQYNVPGNNIYICRGFGDQGLSKETRKNCSVKMVIKDGHIKVSGPVYEWIRCTPQWAREARNEVRHLTLGKNGGDQTETVAEPTAGLKFQVPHSTAESEKLTAEIGVLLAAIKPQLDSARAKVRELREKTGVRLIIKGDMTLGVDFGMASPAAQAQMPEIRSNGAGPHS